MGHKSILAESIECNTCGGISHPMRTKQEAKDQALKEGFVLREIPIDMDNGVLAALCASCAAKFATKESDQPYR